MGHTKKKSYFKTLTKDLKKTRYSELGQTNEQSYYQIDKTRLSPTFDSHQSSFKFELSVKEIPAKLKPALKKQESTFLEDMGQARSQSVIESKQIRV
jgi:hypothetical protein